MNLIDWTKQDTVSEYFFGNLTLTKSESNYIKSLQNYTEENFEE